MIVDNFIIYKYDYFFYNSYDNVDNNEGAILELWLKLLNVNLVKR